MGKFFKDLKKGLEEYIAYTEGKIGLRSTPIRVAQHSRSKSSNTQNEKIRTDF